MELRFSGDLRYSFVPKPEQRAWRRLSRTWKSLGEQIIETGNEIEALLEEGQIKLSCVVSDQLGVSGKRVLRALAEGQNDPEQLARLFDRRVRASEQERVDALDGRLPAAHRLVLKQHLDRIELLERQRDELQKCLEQLMEHCAPAVKRLRVDGCARHQCRCGAASDCRDRAGGVVVSGSRAVGVVGGAE